MRFLSLVAAALAAAVIWAAPALAATPALDGSAATGISSNATTVTATITTGGATCTGAKCIAILGVTGTCVAASACTTGAYTVSGVSGCSLTWTKRKAVAGSGTGLDGTNNIDLEEWSAPYSSTLSACTVTVTFTGAIYGALGIQGISAVCSSSPFDPTSASSHLAAMVAGVATLGTQTTSKTNDLIFVFAGGEFNDSYSSSQVTGNAGTELMRALNTSGALYSLFDSAYVTETTAQSGTTSQTFSGSHTYTAAQIGDAVTNTCGAAGSTLAHLLTLLGVGQ